LEPGAPRGSVQGQGCCRGHPVRSRRRQSYARSVRRRRRSTLMGMGGGASTAFSLYLCATKLLLRAQPEREHAQPKLHFLDTSYKIILNSNDQAGLATGHFFFASRRRSDLIQRIRESSSSSSSHTSSRGIRRLSRGTGGFPFAGEDGRRQSSQRRVCGSSSPPLHRQRGSSPCGAWHGKYLRLHGCHGRCLFRFSVDYASSGILC
jgi:hypothetical protein